MGDRGRRVSLWLDEDAAELLDRMTTVHRRGRFLSELIRRRAAERAAEQLPAPSPGEQLRSIEDRLERIEGKLDGLMGAGDTPAVQPEAEAQTPASHQGD